MQLDLSSLVPFVSGPKRPHDLVEVSQLPNDFKACMSAPAGFKGFGIAEDKHKATAKFTFEGQEHEITHGSVVIAAITSCTNTSNPSVMLQSAMLCKNAVEKGLTCASYIKKSLSPGSGVVTKYMELSGLNKYMD